MASTITKKRSRRKSSAPRAGRSRNTNSTAQDEHLKELMKQAVREVLIEEQWIAGDPDAGLEVRSEIIAALKEQDRRVAEGEQGKPLAQVLKELGLD